MNPGDNLEATAAPLLSVRSISKAFPGVQALSDVSLEVGSGEVLALVGENGAGKSTLIRSLGGAQQPDAGEIRIAGEPKVIDSPTTAQRLGVAVIYQEFNLIPGLSVRENIFLGRDLATAGWIARRREMAATHQLMERIGIQLDPETPVNRLSIAQQQIVEIAKSLAQNARLLVMDEPSATLTPVEVEALFRIIRELQQQGIGIVYVSHRLEEIFEIADRILVLRDGAVAGQARPAEVSRAELIELMVGRELSEEFPPNTRQPSNPRLVVKGLTRGETVRDVSFELRAGEILALTGLVGAGRTETARLLFGADQAEEGSIELDGRALQIRSPQDAIRNRISMLTEDRKGQGLVLNRSILENFGLPNLPRLNRFGFVRQTAERQSLESYVQRLNIRLASLYHPVRNLSGGNQQKVVLAKWLQANADVIIFDEPTRGIDVGAKFEIYQLMNDLAASGKCILMISSELPEVLGMSDRILVMHGGRITGELNTESANQEQVMQLAVQ